MRSGGRGWSRAAAIHQPPDDHKETSGRLQGDCRALGLGLGQAKEGQERRQEFGDDVIGRILPMLQVYPEKAHRRDEGAEAGWL